MDSRKDYNFEQEEKLIGTINTNLSKLEKIQEEGNEIITSFNSYVEKIQSKLFKMYLNFDETIYVHI